jgi:amidase
MSIFEEYELFDGLGLVNLVRQEIISPVELLEACIARIEQKNPQLNAVIHKMYDQARLQIKQNPSSGLFYGVPFLLKDLLADYAGEPQQLGSRFARQYVSEEDCELVKRFKQAGLIIVGKTNTPEFGLSPTTEPEFFGATRNPWDLSKSSGGSSGGSAAAVASGMVPMAHGGDGGGSLRIPASFCGLFGLKPSRGRTPIGPQVMQVWQGMVVQHVLTRTVRDSAAMLDVLSGPELGSPISLPKVNFSYLDSLAKPTSSLKIALLQQPFFQSDIHPDYQKGLIQSAELLIDLGHQVEPVSFNVNSSEVALAFMIMIAAETAEYISLLSLKLKDKANKNELETTTAVLCEVGEHFSAKDLSWAYYILDRVRVQSAEFFLSYDCMLSLTMPAPPPTIGQFKPLRYERNILEILRHLPYGPILRKLTRRISAKYLAFTPFTPLFNITGQPAMSVPLFKDSQGMPIGIHFAGQMQDELTLLTLAQQLETYGWGKSLSNN